MDKCLETRLAAFRIIRAVVTEQKTTDEAFYMFSTDSLPDSDKQFVRMLVMTTLRHYGQIQTILSYFLSRPLPSKRIEIRLILAMGVAQLIFMGTPAHAAVDTSVRLVRHIKQPAFTRLINGVLRQLDRQKDVLAMPSTVCNIPEELKRDWEKTYGITRTQAITDMLIQEPPLDITVKSNPEKWATELNGTVMPTGSVRMVSKSGITQRLGFASGDWWVQEASASIPVQLFPYTNGLRIADLCAAPGGKTAQLVVRGAQVDAYDISSKRLNRLRENMNRLQLTDSIRIICCDIMDLKIPDDGLYDGVLLDAPCSATGTIRRHPDLLFHRTMADIKRLSELQRQLIQKAWTLLKPDGYMVYATCSLQQAENEDVIKWAIQNIPDMERVPVDSKWIQFTNNEGAIQVTPDMNQDGFYTVLLHKKP